jgi:phosphoglycolate phosphatase/pyrophosphatase PpaX
MAPYRCLILDHDDTTVDSTRTVNYPQFRQALAHFRPDMTMTQEEYILHCFHMGFYVMCDKVLHYTEAEIAEHLQMWKNYHKLHHPPFFPGIPELITRHREQGGLICVVSHSSADVILSAYENAGVTAPDLIFGAEQPTEHMKPNVWPLMQIMERFSLKPEECLVVDDAPMGGEMARQAGVEFACAGWYGMLPEIEDHMRQSSDYFFASVGEFAQFLERI